MTVEEKIRRAEEIYKRRSGNNYTYKTSSQKNTKERSLMRRMVKQIIICFLIYGVFYVVTNREYFLSQEFKTEIEQLASQNETTKNIYNNINKYIEKYIKPIILYQEKNEEEPNRQQNQTENNEQQEEVTSQIEEQENTIQIQSDENIGGAEEVKQAEKTQEEQDIEKIKNTTKFIKPIEGGTISSTFGWRTPTTATVPKYHTGLDIAVKSGTKIKSATNGKVILASSEGDYGNHYKIQLDDIIIIYAHCSKLYLKEGDDVFQGQEIAEVGSTGNSTRPTFTF